ncbi:MAG: leucine-rich repeat domain-containing protein [Pseudomonadota bacterium]|nr:leucine-rich repeat domain-containing protein [Pseudomonadota bacterium]
MFEPYITALFNYINNKIYTKFKGRKLTFDRVTHVTHVMMAPYRKDYIDPYRKNGMDPCREEAREVVILNSVTSIGKCAFEYCFSLISITIPDSVTTIGFRAFHGCSNLTSITIPNSVTNIEQGTFCGCSSLTDITIPNSVTNIEERAFNGCSSLTFIKVPNGVTEIGLSAFKNCSSLNRIIIPDSLEKKDTNYWEHKGIDLNNTELITHKQLSAWAKRHKLKEKSIEKLSTLYQLQKDNDYQPSWSELGKKSRHIIIGDLLTILPENKKNHVLAQTLIGQHDSKEGQLLHTLSLLSQAPTESLDQEKVSLYDDMPTDTKTNQTRESSKDNSLSLGVSLSNHLTLGETAKLLLYCTENTAEMKKKLTPKK